MMSSGLETPVSVHSMDIGIPMSSEASSTSSIPTQEERDSGRVGCREKDEEGASLFICCCFLFVFLFS